MLHFWGVAQSAQHLVVTQALVGSSPTAPASRGVAQLVERLPVGTVKVPNGEGRGFESHLQDQMIEDKQFALTVSAAAQQVGAQTLADRLSVSRPTVKRWIEGRNLPMPAMRVAVVRICEGLTVPR